MSHSTSVILIGLTLRTPGVPRLVQTVLSGLVSKGSEVVQVQVRRSDRRVPHPGLDGEDIHAKREPEAGGGVPEIVSATAYGNCRPGERRLERGGVPPGFTPAESSEA